MWVQSVANLGCFKCPGEGKECGVKPHVGLSVRHAEMSVHSCRMADSLLGGTQRTTVFLGDSVQRVRCLTCRQDRHNVIGFHRDGFFGKTK